MPHFDDFVARHGEVAVQAILENLERAEGMQPEKMMSLEDRWQRLMKASANRRVA